MSGDLMVELSIRFVALIVLIAYFNKGVPYLSIDIPSTTISGAQAVKGPNGLIAGIDWRIPITKKYIFAKR